MRPDRCCGCECCADWRAYFRMLRRAWALLKGIDYATAAIHWPTTQPLLIPDRKAP